MFIWFWIDSPSTYKKGMKKSWGLEGAHMVEHMPGRCESLSWVEHSQLLPVPLPGKPKKRKQKRKKASEFLGLCVCLPAFWGWLRRRESISSRTQRPLTACSSQIDGRKQEAVVGVKSKHSDVELNTVLSVRKQVLSLSSPFAARAEHRAHLHWGSSVALTFGSWAECNSFQLAFSFVSYWHLSLASSEPLKHICLKWLFVSQWGGRSGICILGTTLREQLPVSFFFFFGGGQYGLSGQVYGRGKSTPSSVHTQAVPDSVLRSEPRL